VPNPTGIGQLTALLRAGNGLWAFGLLPLLLAVVSLLDTVHRAFEPAHASVWLAARDSTQPL
jgi:hypothetical protein